MLIGNICRIGIKECKGQVDKIAGFYILFLFSYIFVLVGFRDFF